MLAHHYKRVFWVVLLIALAIAFYTYSTRQKPVNVQVSEVTLGVIEDTVANTRAGLSLIHISEPTRQDTRSRMPSSA